jgi:hypothetical protein
MTKSIWIKIQTRKQISTQSIDVKDLLRFVIGECAFAFADFSCLKKESSVVWLL